MVFLMLMLDDIHALTVQCWWQDEKINAEVCAVCSVLPCLTFSDKDKQDVYDWLYNPTTVSPDISARLSAIMVCASLLLCTSAWWVE